MTESEKAVFKIHIQGSVEDVWREITKTDEVQGCMFNMQLHTNGLAPGGQIRMRTVDGKYTGVVGEVLEFDPPKRYSHTFRFTNYEDPPCKVTYELKEAKGGVDFSLIIDDLPAGTKTAKQMTKGGDFIVKTLKSIVETGKLPVGTRALYTLFKVMAPLSPKKTLTENWPMAGA
jgi:uncharacterized protein YndB with AHSA1/START domain